jgi:hypothetical protein
VTAQAPRPTLHPALRWALLATLLLSAWFATRAPEAEPVAAAVPRHSAVGAAAREPAALRPGVAAPSAGWPAGPSERLQGWPLLADAERRAWGAPGPGLSDGAAEPGAVGAAAASARSGGTAAGRAAEEPAEAALPAPPAAPPWRLVGQLELAPGRIASTFVHGEQSVIALPGEALDAAWTVARAERGAALLAARGGAGSPGASAAANPSTPEHWLRLPEAR